MGLATMYHPYFRGKQYELIAVRENAQRMADAGFVPTIEPVREALGGLDRALEAVCDARGKAIVIINPRHGDHADDGQSISALLKARFLTKADITVGILLTEGMDVADILAECEEHKGHQLALVHSGFSGNGKDLATRVAAKYAVSHLFIDSRSNKLYRRHFAGSQRVLIKDGFRRQKKNSDYPLLEPFSDLHLTYSDEGMDGFGDFLTVGDDFTEGGGPAYAIAIHLTFIDPDKDGAMFIYHFKSKRIDTPTDPAGKFAEALQAMMDTVNAPGSKVFNSTALDQFRAIHKAGHFPGLGSVKKLSMQHHIETLAAAK